MCSGRFVSLPTCEQGADRVTVEKSALLVGQFLAETLPDRGTARSLPGSTSRTIATGSRSMRPSIEGPSGHTTTTGPSTQGAGLCTKASTPRNSLLIMMDSASIQVVTLSCGLP